jgi:hypothetical protein
MYTCMKSRRQSVALDVERAAHVHRFRQNAMRTVLSAALPPDGNMMAGFEDVPDKPPGHGFPPGDHRLRPPSAEHPGKQRTRHESGESQCRSQANRIDSSEA